jgi:hypothetical protein
MFCPNCEAEYKEGITFCPDCSLELVAVLAPDNRVHDKSGGSLVPLRSFNTAAEAEMVNQILSQNGIRSFVEGSEFSIVPGTFSQEVVIMVDERDVARAVDIYEAYFDAEEPAPSNEDQTEG